MKIIISVSPIYMRSRHRQGQLLAVQANAMGARVLKGHTETEE